MQIIVILLNPDKFENPDVLSLKTILKSDLGNSVNKCTSL